MLQTPVTYNMHVWVGGRGESLDSHSSETGPGQQFTPSSLLLHLCQFLKHEARVPPTVNVHSAARVGVSRTQEGRTHSGVGLICCVILGR